MNVLQSCLFAFTAVAATVGLTSLDVRSAAATPPADPTPPAETAPVPLDIGPGQLNPHWKCILSAFGGETLVCVNNAGNIIASSFCTGLPAPVCAFRPR